jgi:FMN phosphatase YigB (HAD superfamily)
LTANAIRALLLDLDDTLLINDMDTFAPHYFKALVAKMQRVCPPQIFIPALDMATRMMMHNDGRNGTNAEVFRHEFFARVPRKPEELMPLFDEFYARDFEALRTHTRVDPDARTLVTLALEHGYQVAIATQPVFPRVAILARLRWANVGAEEFHYDYVPSYETMSACKPHPHYFTTLVQRLGRVPSECLMVGDSLDSDMPASKYGLRTFCVVRGEAAKPSTPLIHAQGNLRDLIALIETGGIDEL